MRLLSDVRLKWYDDSSLLEEDSRRLLELLLDSLGVTSDVARDVFHVLLAARAEDRALTVGQIRDAVVNLRRMRNVRDLEKGLTVRNIQVWLKYFRRINLVDKLGSRYHFRGNKKPSRAFVDHTRPLVEGSLEYVGRLFEKVEDSYGIR